MLYVGNEAGPTAGPAPGESVPRYPGKHPNPFDVHGLLAAPSFDKASRQSTIGELYILICAR